MTNDVQTGAPALLRRLDSPAATQLAALCAAFEDLQTALRCCERLVSELTAPRNPLRAGPPDEVLVEAVWTLALLSYARCFAAAGATHTAAVLTKEDVVATHPEAKVLDWHTVLLRLRDHYVDVAVNPREIFSVGVAQDPVGRASGVAVTSIRQPPVDEVTVRQMGAIAYALSIVVDARIAERQSELFAEVKDVSVSELEKLQPLELAPASVEGDPSPTVQPN